jgi:voltage-gated potassium channel
MRKKSIQSRSQASQALEGIALFFILYSIITYTIETLPDLPSGALLFLRYSEIVVSIFFAVEYIIRIVSSPKPLRCITSFYGIVDVVAIVPFVLGTGVDARALRIVRIFRVFRLFKLVRYNSAIKRFGKAMELAKEELVLFFVAAIVLVYLAALGIYHFENVAQPDKFQSVIHSMWWAVATLTTVGYGDVFPVTAGGKLFTALMLSVGLGIVAVPTGLISSALTRVRQIEERSTKEKESIEE